MLNIHEIAERIDDALSDGTIEPFEAPRNMAQLERLIAVVECEDRRGTFDDGTQWRVEDGFAILPDGNGEYWVDITNGPFVDILGL